MLDTLPVELLYSVHLHSASEHLPYVSRRLFSVFKRTSSLYRAEYLLERYFRANPLNRTSSPSVKSTLPSPQSRAHECTSTRNIRADAGKTKGSGKQPQNIVTFALQYPLCNEPTLEMLLRLHECPEVDKAETVLLPRRLFKHLVSEDKETGRTFTRQDHPLPFLRYLYNRPPWTERKAPSGDEISAIPTSRNFNAPSANSHEGYPLVRAVHAGHIPLVQFLLAHSASPTCKQNLALRVAIRKQDLRLVRMLIEREESEGLKNANGKRRRLEDRLEVTVDMLKAAVNVGARDIVNYFMDEKGVRPDMQTLKTMERRGFFDE